MQKETPEITLQSMTERLYHECFMGFETDPDIFADMSLFRPFTYNKAAIDTYILRQKEKQRLPFAIMLNDKPVGEVLLKNIDHDKGECTLSIHLQNDSVKNKGIGTAAEKLMVAYAFEQLNMKTVHADSILKNKRSQRVLEKVGFSFINQDEEFVYYRLDKNNTLR